MASQRRIITNSSVVVPYPEMLGSDHGERLVA
jgi:hypothetical protein